MSDEMKVSTETKVESEGGLHELPPSDPPAPPTAEEIDTLLGLIQKDARPYVKMMRDGIDPWDAIVATKRVETLETAYAEAIQQLEEISKAEIKAAARPQSEDGKKLEEAVRSIAQQTHGVNPRNHRGGKLYDVTVPEADAALLRVATGVATT